MLAFCVGWLTRPEAAVLPPLAPQWIDREFDESAERRRRQVPSDVLGSVRVFRDWNAPDAPGA
jgi:hypothetical protein